MKQGWKLAAWVGGCACLLALAVFAIIALGELLFAFAPEHHQGL